MCERSAGRQVRRRPPGRPDRHCCPRRKGRGAGSKELEKLLGDEERAISVITVRELLHGVHRAAGARRATRRAFVEHLLGGLDPIPITEPVARVHAEVWADLAGRGVAIGAHDLWIAATAMANGLGVATLNAADFGRVPGLRVIAPDEQLGVRE